MYGICTVPECNVCNVIATLWTYIHITLWNSDGLPWHRSLLHSNENIFVQNLQFLKRPYLSISGNIMKLLWHSIIIPVWRSKCHYNSVDCLWMKQYWSRVRLWKHVSELELCLHLVTEKWNHIITIPRTHSHSAVFGMNYQPNCTPRCFKNALQMSVCFNSNRPTVL
jgi:hypothetical protein